MKILVAIANYGTGSRQYVDQVLDTFRNMSYNIDLVVHSNIDKDMGDDVEVVVGLPSKNPWSLPFAHKQYFVDHVDDYDLFIYTEDDILVSENAIDAFIESSKDLNEDEISGYMRVEYQPDDAISYDMCHSFYRWDPRTVVERNGDLYAWFSNEHAAVYALTRKHLRRCIDSGGFLVEPYRYRYGLPETAATDPYTSCGLTKLINVSRLDDFLVHHLPNKYVDIYGIDADAMAVQVDALGKIARGELPAEVLIEVESRLPSSRGSKMIYAEPDVEMLDLIDSKPKDLLVVGAGFGTIERELMSRGHRVTGVPIDSVIRYTLSSQGIEVTSANLDKSIQELAGRQFNTLIFPDSLHLFEDPVSVLKAYHPLLKQGGGVILSLPNTGDAKIVLSRLKGEQGYEALGDFQITGTHHTTRAKASSWAKHAGFRDVKAKGLMTPKRKKIDRMTLGMAVNLLAERWLFHAKKP